MSRPPESSTRIRAEFSSAGPPRRRPSRRRGVVAAEVITESLHRRRSPAHAGRRRSRCPAGAAARRARSQTVAENQLPGDRNWWIGKLGAPDAIMGYADQASVLPGEPVRLYVSTTSREFTVRAFRMGWYRGDLARKVWESGTVRGHRQRALGPDPRRPTPCTPTGASR